MTKINLNIQIHSTDMVEPCYLKEAIEKQNLVVILGNPGSGKTSILEKYAEENPNSRFVKIKKFIRLDHEIPEDIDTLLLDGLDEYRSVSNDKTFVIDELSEKLKRYSDKRIVISCRELDWYGEQDSKALKDELGAEAKVYSILPLNDSQKLELAEALHVLNPMVFLETFSQYGFLDNPQMFTMLVELYKVNPDIVFSSKIELYQSFIKQAKEKNPERTKNDTTLPTGDTILKITGYLAFFYLFTELDIFSDDIIDEIADNEKGHTKELLLQVLNTSLFENRSFTHRTIAEFALAHYLMHEKMRNSLSKERIKSLLIYSGRIPTELRGVYAWLCALSQDMDMIKTDPYYQAVYGDNSLFGVEKKKEIVSSVQEYAITHPWFIDFWMGRGTFKSIGELYDPAMDDFFVQKIEETKRAKNHYLYFLVYILNSANNLSDKMKDYLKEKVLDNEIKSYVKDDILKIFSEDKVFLLDVLNAIRDKKIEDEDQLKEFILKILYPAIITPEQITEYLLLYQNDDVTGYAHYLFSTPYEAKFQLVENLLQTENKIDIRKKADTNYHIRLPSFMDRFIEDYLFETIEMYPEHKSSDEIYDIIEALRKHVDEYIPLKFKPYYLRGKSSDEKNYSKLAEALFEIHIHKALLQANSVEDGSDIITKAYFGFEYFFPFTFEAKLDFLLRNINPHNTHAVNRQFYRWALTYLPFGYTHEVIDPKVLATFLDIAKEYGFEKELAFRLSEEKPEWVIKQELRNLQQKKKEENIREKNEAMFAERPDDEVFENLGALEYISQHLISEENNCDTFEYLKPDTCERLKSVLKKLMFEESKWQEFATQEAYAESEGDRNIDYIYYASLVLNNSNSVIEANLHNNVFFDYLYVLAIRNGNVLGWKETNFVKLAEEKFESQIKKLLKQYIGYLFKKHYDESYYLFDTYIKRGENLEFLKEIAKSHTTNLGTIKESLLKTTIAAFWPEMNIEDLVKLQKMELPEKIIPWAEALTYLKMGSKEKFATEHATALHEIIEYHRFVLYDKIDSNERVKIIDYLFSVFDTEKSIVHVGGFQSAKSQAASFTRDAVSTLALDELKALFKLHHEEGNIWRNRILNQIDTLEQQNADHRIEKYSIAKIKSFALSDAILSKGDFFRDVILKLQFIRDEIESNRDNEKKLFYNDDGSTKNEEYCRDVILQKVKDKYGYDLECTKEKHEADNRVDINIKYKTNLDYEVQIECKKDRNQGLYDGINNQLIDKYLSINVEYGVYLIFYFGDKNKESMIKRLHESIPGGYEENVKIVIFDISR